jgi:hypothetical protein
MAKTVRLRPSKRFSLCPRKRGFPILELLSPPTLRERRHRGLARRLVAWCVDGLVLVMGHRSLLMVITNALIRWQPWRRALGSVTLMTLPLDRFLLSDLSGFLAPH